MGENEEIINEKYLEIGKILKGTSIEDAVLILNKCLYAVWYQIYHAPDKE